MHTGRIVFSQLMDFLPRHEFNRCVRRYHGKYRTRHFKCRDQFLCMAFAQLTGRESLRDIETCLRAMQPKLYHAGLRYPVSRSTLADANENRDGRIYADLAQVLIGHARKLYSQDDFGVQLEETAYVFDSSTIDLCLSLFPWARFRQRKAAIKLHTLMDLRGNIPCFLPALTIPRLYKCRKQHLQIKAFFGTSENAVKTQIWIAISTYVRGHRQEAATRRPPSGRNPANLHRFPIRESRYFTIAYESQRPMPIRASLQKLWAEVLSGEVENPGRTSLRTLDILRNLTQEDAMRSIQNQ